MPVTCKVLILATLAGVSVASSANAQSVLDARAGHGFATVGFIEAGNDSADGVNQFGQVVNRGHLLVSGGVFVAPRVGIGIETYPKHTTAAELASYESFDESEQLQEKTTVMFTARGRAVAQSRFALDGVFGVGALRQTRTSTTNFHDPRSPTTTLTTDDTSAAFSLGADATFSVARHVVVIPQFRLYHLRRLGNALFAPGLTQSPLDAPTSLFAFGMTAGITW